jgi:hypothetical protein
LFICLCARVYHQSHFIIWHLNHFLLAPFFFLHFL